MSESVETKLSLEMSQAHEKIQNMIREVEKVVVGKRAEIIFLMTALLSGSHILIEDVPGTGKTMLASALSRVTGLRFKRAQFTPDVMASDITGFNIYNRQNMYGRAGTACVYPPCLPKSAAGGGSQWREAFILTIDG